MQPSQRRKYVGIVYTDTDGLNVKVNAQEITTPEKYQEASDEIGAVLEKYGYTLHRSVRLIINPWTWLYVFPTKKEK